MPHTVPALLDEIARSLLKVESSLPRRIDALSVSRVATLPFKVVYCREVLAWRCVELGREALEALNRDRLVTSVLLVRAVVETVAAQWHLHRKVVQALETRSVNELKRAVHRLLLGSRTSDQLPEALNVLTFIDAASKDLPELRAQFDRLCEFSHPNWAGTAQMFSQPDHDAPGVDLGPNIRGQDTARTLAAVNLSVAMLMFESAYDDLADNWERFVELCDASVDQAV